MARYYECWHTGQEVEFKFPYNPEIVEEIKRIPSHQRSWDPDLKRWSVSAHYWQQIEDMFEENGYSCRTSHNEERKPPPQKSASSYHHVLYVTADAPDFVIEAAYRVLIRKHHPDVGGDPATATAINVAYQNLKAK